MSSHKYLAQDKSGFTIVELMIATMIFSVILLVITAGVISFSKSYYKSVYDSMTQNSVRNITESFVKAVQFGKADVDVTGVNPVADSGYFCAGGYLFFYRKGQLYQDGSTQGFYMQPNTQSSCIAPAASDPVPQERVQFLAERMSVQYVSVTSSGDTASIEVRLAYGDLDLLKNAGTNSVVCTTGEGKEYCSVANLKATAVQRV